MLSRSAILLGATIALALPGSALAAPSVTKTGNVFTYNGDANANFVTTGIKKANSGDVAPNNDGDQPNKFVFLDASIPANPGIQCVDYVYDPPDFIVTNPPRKVGVVCTGDASTTVAANLDAGDDLIAAAAFFFCGSFFSSTPCVTTLSRALTVNGGDGNDSISSGTGPGTLNGESGDDFVGGGSGIDAVDGGAGHDTLSGNFGADDIHGGSGVDEVTFNYTADRVLVSLNDQADDGSTVPTIEGDNVHTDVEDITGSTGSDIMTGSSGSNTLTGGAGDDQLDGGGGIDSYYGQAGGDTLNTRDGNSERVDCGDDSDVSTTDNGDEKSGCEVDSTSDALEGDLDKDGVREPADCNDRDPAIKPGAEDKPDNGVDENCDGADATIKDRDKDGFTAPADCDDANPAAHPGALEIYGNTIDENCNGKADPLLSISAFVRSSFSSGKKSTSIRLLRGASLKAGTEVRVTCSGKPRACSFATKSVAVTKDGEVDLRGQLALRTAKVGGKIEVLLLRPDSLAKRTTFTFRKGKLPTSKIDCTDAKSGMFTRCP